MTLINYTSLGIGYNNTWHNVSFRGINYSYTLNADNSPCDEDDDTGRQK